MKAPVVLWIMLGITLAASPKAIAGGNNGTGDIPLPAGQFSAKEQGSFALCLNPTNGAAEPCTASGVLIVPQSLVATGALTRDRAGNACLTHTYVFSALPVDAAPPTVQEENTVFKVINYDAATGTGDESFISYVGGKCSGPTFHGTGATQVVSGTVHFVVAANGNRIDGVFTALIGSPGQFSIGAFSNSLTERRQTSP
jgi:hypothetical protein